MSDYTVEAPCPNCSTDMGAEYDKWPDTITCPACEKTWPVHTDEDQDCNYWFEVGSDEVTP